MAQIILTFHVTEKL